MDAFAASATGHLLPSIVTPDGKTRLLGRRADMVPHYRMAKKADPAWLLDESKWVEFDRTQTGIAILDQGQVGECTGEALVNTDMIARAVSGQPYQLLSGSSVYAQINGGVDQGASLTDAVQASQTFGACLASDVPEGFYTKAQLARQYPGALKQATRFTTSPDAWTTFSSFAEAGSLAQMGWQLYISVTASGNWDASQFSADGVPPFQSGSGNHAQSAGEAMKLAPKSRQKSGSASALIKVRNSWSAQWGLGGFYWIDDRFIDQQSQFEGYALYFASEDPQDPNMGPTA